LPSLGIRRTLTFHILIFSSETPQPNELINQMNMQCILDARNNFYISYFESHKKSLKQLHIIVRFSVLSISSAFTISTYLIRDLFMTGTKPCVSISGNLNKSAKQPMKIVVANACRIQCKQGSNVAPEFISDIRTGTTYPNIATEFISDICYIRVSSSCSNIRDELSCYIRISRSCSNIRDELSC
jgi:hypothetical protein